jgi:hypothetical protein
MKKPILILVGIAIFVYSCKKDTKTPIQNNITGKWYYTNDVVTQYNNGVLQWQQTDAGITLYGAYWQQFNSDGTGLQQDSTNSTPFTYSISGQVISITESGSVEKATIKNLTSNSLELYFDDKNPNGTEDTEDATFSKTRP